MSDLRRLKATLAKFAPKNIATLSFPVSPTTFLAAENLDFPVIGNLIFFEDLSLLLIGSAGLYKHSLVSTPHCFL